MEMLVVIALITTLMALILPSLEGARASARAAICGSNLRQMSIAVTSYGDEANYFPIGISSSGGVWIWPTIIREHMKQGTEVFNCPEADEFARWKKTFGSGLPASDGYELDEVRLKAGGNSFMSYGYNVWGSHVGRSPNTGLGVYRGHANYGEQKISSVVAPSNMVEFADSNYTVDGNWSGFVGLEAERQYPSEIHKGSANIAFVDNHVERLQRPQIGDHFNPEVNRRWNVTNRSVIGYGGP